MAHLLTASLDQAETACREALDAWNGEVEGDEALLRHGAAAALRTRPGPCPSSLNNSLSGGSYLPAELQAVLKLPQPLRRCFALRMLAGFSTADCAQLLRLRSRDIEKLTRSAVIRLATLNRRELKEGHMDQDTHYEVIEHLAYQLWLERGSPIGSPDEDWFHAERVLHGDRIDEIPANALILQGARHLLTFRVVGEQRDWAFAVRKEIDLFADPHRIEVVGVVARKP